MPLIISKFQTVKSEICSAVFLVRRDGIIKEPSLYRVLAFRNDREKYDRFCDVLWPVTSKFSNTRISILQVSNIAGPSGLAV